MPVSNLNSISFVTAVDFFCWCFCCCVHEHNLSSFHRESIFPSILFICDVTDQLNLALIELPFESRRLLWDELHRCSLDMYQQNRLQLLINTLHNQFRYWDCWLYPRFILFLSFCHFNSYTFLAKSEHHVSVLFYWNDRFIQMFISFWKFDFKLYWRNDFFFMHLKRKL